MPRCWGRRTRASIVLGFLVQLTAATPTLSFAQPADAAAAPADSPTLIARGGADETGTAVAISSADVQITIAGFLSRTVTTLTFHNKTDRTLEGDLVFPLPDGATVSGYGLDIDGEIVDAVVVDAQAARMAFEDETRRGVDPGLVEWIRGNSFRTRVWPIPAQGRRTVRVEYVALLTRDASGVLLYQLPLRYSLKVPELTLRLEVLDRSVKPTIESRQLTNLEFTAWERRLVASARLQNQSLSDDLRVSIPPVEQRAASVETYKDGRTYFALDDIVELGEAPPAARPHRVGLLWDASLSHADADVQRELEVVTAWLAALGDVEVVLTVFRNVAEPPQTLAIRGGDPRPLLAALTREPRDGGTSLQALRASPGVAYYLLVSDGFTSVNHGLPEGLGAPVYTLTASVRADHSLLRALARASGGQHIPLSALTSAEAATRIGRAPAGRVWIEYDRTALADVLPATPEPVDGRVTVTGRLLAREAQITLRYVAASGVITNRRFTFRKDGSAASGLVPRFWAERKAAELSAVPARFTSELVALGKEFGIVTPGTSLLVLETLDQHLRHGIEPPESRPGLRAEYREQIAARRHDAARTRKDKIERVLAMWRARVGWWNGKPPRSASQSAASEEPGPAQSTRTPRIVNCQGRTIALRGRVTDVAGADIPGATVIATRTATNDAVSVTTNADGGYSVCDVSPGLYTIQVELPGFRSWHRQVALPSTRPLNVTLEIGALTETVTVAAEAAPHSLSVASPGTTSATQEQPSSEGPAITIKPWDPETPYLTALKQAGMAKAYAAYLAERERYAASPSFYLDCAGYFLANRDRATGLRVLTSILDLQLEDPRLLRVVAHRLQQLGELDLATDLFEQVLRLRPEEPQSLRDLALAVTARGDAARAAGAERIEIARDYLRALELLEQLVLGEWDDRFPEIETVALMDANRLLAIMEREKLPGLDRVTLDRRLRQSLDLDIRIVLTWDTDQTDMDLWVTEPTGEKCDYSHNRTAIGGMMSDDFTGGYGPEEYLLRRAPTGSYLIQANYFGSRSQSLTGPTTAQATVITDFARPGERRQTLTLRLSDAKDVVEIGSVRFDGPTKTP